MNIVSLEVQNIKKLKALRIDPKGNVVVIGGKNGAGKSSVLDAIMCALGGKEMAPTVPIRRGETDASICLDLGDYIVRRSFNEAGNSYLKVETKEGAQFKSPQAILDKLVGSLSFDPLDFSRMDPKAQVKTLKALVGLDFGDLDATRAEAYQSRTIINKSARDLQGVFENMPHHPEAPEAEVSVTELFSDLEKINSANQENQKIRAEVQSLRQKVQDRKDRLAAKRQDITSLKATLAALEAEAERMATELEISIERGKELAAKAEQLRDEDDAHVREQIKSADTTNAKVRENKEREKLGQKVEEIAAQAEALTRQIEEIDQAKAEKLAAADFPIPNMSFDENGVLLNGLPFSQASSAEQLRASVAMGLALNPRLKVLLVRDGSLLDPESLAMVAEMAAAAEAQIWIERVSDGEEVSVIIEDGEIKGSHLKAVNQ